MAASHNQKLVRLIDVQNEIDRIIKEHYTADNKTNTYVKTTLELLFKRLGG